MSDTVSGSVYREAFLTILEETFESVQGMYLDKGDSLFETLADVSAQEASRAIGPTCSSIAAQVTHLIYFFDVGLQYAAGNPPEHVDWSRAWETTTVTDAEWSDLNNQLRDRYQQWIAMVKATDKLDGDMIAGGFNMAAHSAYHLGEIRQALCALRQ